jgi:hypothetical protein
MVPEESHNLAQRLYTIVVYISWHLLKVGLTKILYTFQLLNPWSGGWSKEYPEPINQEG